MFVPPCSTSLLPSRTHGRTVTNGARLAPNLPLATAPCRSCGTPQDIFFALHRSIRAAPKMILKLGRRECFVWSEDFDPCRPKPLSGWEHRRPCQHEP